MEDENMESRSIQRRTAIMRGEGQPTFERTPAEDGERAVRLENAARARVRTSAIKVQEIAYHRNGITAAAFYVIAFVYNVPGETAIRNMIATVFRARGHVAVFDRDLLALGNIAFGGTDDGRNSWRGDNFEEDLRAVICLERGADDSDDLGW